MERNPLGGTGSACLSSIQNKLFTRNLEMDRSMYFFNFWLCTSEWKSIDHTGKRVLKLVILPSLKVICRKLWRYCSSKSRNFADAFMVGGTKLTPPPPHTHTHTHTHTPYKCLYIFATLGSYIWAHLRLTTFTFGNFTNFMALSVVSTDFP